MPPRGPADGSKTVGHPTWATRLAASVAKPKPNGTSPSSSPTTHAPGRRRWAWNRGGGWRWLDDVATAPASGAPAPRLADIEQALAANNVLKEKLAAALKGQAGSGDSLEDNDDDDGVDISMEADVPTKETIAAKKKLVAALQSLLADEADEESAAALRKHETQLAEMVAALARARPVGEQRQAKIRALKLARHSYEHHENKKIPGNVAKVAEMEDALALLKDKQAKDLARYDELRVQIQELEREVQLLDEASSGSSASAVAPLTKVGSSSVLDASRVHAVFDVAHASLRDVPGGLEALEVLRAGLNGAVIPAPTASTSPPPAPSPAAAAASGAGTALAAADPEPAESVVSSLDDLDDSPDDDTYNSVSGLLETEEQKLRAQEVQLQQERQRIGLAAAAAAAELQAKAERDVAALEAACARAATKSSGRAASLRERLAGCESLPPHRDKKYKPSAPVPAP